MKNISLKAEDAIFEETNEILSSLSISRNRYINDAIAYYNRIKSRELLGKKLEKESNLVRLESIAVLREFEMIDDSDETI